MINQYHFGMILFLLFLLVSCSKMEEPVLPADPTPPTSGSLDLKVLQDNVEGTPIVLVGSRGRNFIAAFQSTLNGQSLSFSPLDNKFPLVMEDDRGNRWNAFGEAVAGPDRGAQLEYVNSGMGYWFVFGAMYPGAEIFGLGSRDVKVDVNIPDDWSIPTSVVAQGSGFDAITALEAPDFTVYHDLSFPVKHLLFLAG